jgi:tripartite-type tricarboxylate transporter receptor subunit TctC
MTCLCRMLVLALVWTSVAGDRTAFAVDYPTRPLRWIVGFSPGGSTDTVARLVARSLSKHLGQEVVVENRTGASSNIAAQFVANSPPDGYTLLLITSSNAINATLNRTLPFNFLTEIQPIAGLVLGPNVMVVNPSVPAKTVADFILHAKANPGKINMASSGTGTSVHLSGELFKAMTRVNLVHVPYRGSAPAMVDLVAGRVQVMFNVMATSLPYIQSGKINALGVTTHRRSKALPELPAIAETVPGYEAAIWLGVGVAKGTSNEIIAKLNEAINAVLAEADIRARVEDLGFRTIPMSPAEFQAHVSAEVEKWATVIEFAGVKPE